MIAWFRTDKISNCLLFSGDDEIGWTKWMLLSHSNISLKTKFDTLYPEGESRISRSKCHIYSEEVGILWRSWFQGVSVLHHPQADTKTFHFVLDAFYSHIFWGFVFVISIYEVTRRFLKSKKFSENTNLIKTCKQKSIESKFHSHSFHFPLSILISAHL